MKQYAPKSFAQEQDAKRFVEACEADFEARVATLSERLIQEKAPILGLCGPSCSGKTTAATKLARHFEECGRGLHIVSLDDFYLEREELNRRARERGDGKIDYDSVDTMDLHALRAFVEQMQRGGELTCPVFDFATGSRTGFRTLPYRAGDRILFEGIQVLYEPIRELFAPMGFGGIFISPESSLVQGEREIQPNELRLARRLVRDSLFRGASPDFTLRLWPHVRENEENNIFPHAFRCAYTLDSTMAYEVGILAPYLASLLDRMEEEDRARFSSYLEDVQPISREYLFPDSLFREFIGD